MKQREFSTEIGGRPLTAVFSNLAEQADGSVIVKYGNSAVLATAVMSDEVREELDYFPLTVDYEERFYAAGQILGSRFLRREGRPSDEAILSGRVVDRTIRPLFDHSIRNEVQIIITILSIEEDDPDVLAVNAASIALLTSDIPWNGPVGAVRIGKMKGEEGFIINPTYTERESDSLLYDTLICGRNGAINMIEISAAEAEESEIEKAFARGLAELKEIQKFQEHIAKEMHKEKRDVPQMRAPEALSLLFKKEFAQQLPDAVISGTTGKKKIYELKSKWLLRVREALPDLNRADAEHLFDEEADACLHKEIVENKRRPDGREMEGIRELYVQAGGVSPMHHGTGIFYRGGTHVLSVLTLGGPGEALTVSSIEEQEGRRRFIHHYNFPPFSTGETGRIGGLNRRMIGHGALAEKALRPVIPGKETFPYTIRVVSECLSSNGSTSMGSVCAGALALMDGGVPIKEAVAGIAMGLMVYEGRHEVLTDIQGPEDGHGDMDFKVAGTRKGITAVQMDVKVDGVSPEILHEVLIKGKKARDAILDLMKKEIPAPRAHISPRAPEIITITIKKEQIGSIIGPGGKTINKIKEDTGVAEILIEEDGTVFITGKNGTAEQARKIIEDMTHEYTRGERLLGTVTRIADFGAFVRLNERTEGLVHISEIAPFRVERVSAVLSVGEKIPVMIKEIDEQGRISLSIKQANPNFVKNKTAHGRG
jgi:polyribonucleotide nucleotidyltransferase